MLVNEVINRKPKHKICELIEIDGQEHLEDYRLKGSKIKFITGKLKDLKEYYAKSIGLGDLIGCIDWGKAEKENLVILKYSGGYAVGIE